MPVTSTSRTAACSRPLIAPRLLFRRVVFLGMWFSFLLAGETIGVDSARAADPPETRDDEQRDTALERQMLNQHVVQSRTQQRELLWAASELREGRIADGLGVLQRILDYWQDSFIWLDGTAHPTSVRRQALRILGDQPAHVLDMYERVQGREAARLLEEATATGNADLFQNVGRRFFFTEAGFRALDWQASRWLDRGKFELAAEHWRRLLSEPVHRPRVTATLVQKAILAHRLSGRPDVAEKIALDFEAVIVAADVRQAGGERSLDTLLAGFSHPEIGGDWLVPYGNARSNRVSDASTPYLRPIWSAALTRETDDSAFSQALAAWEVQRESNLAPTAVTNTAIVAGSALIIRDLERLVAYEARTGRPLWEYRCETSLLDPGQEGLSPPSVGQYLDVQHAYAGNSVWGTFTSDGHNVYVIDALDLTVTRTNSRRMNGTEETDPLVEARAASNRLVAIDLGSSEGPLVEKKPQWTAGGVAGAENAADTLAGHFFLGPPLPADGRLYAVTEHDRQLNLVALEPETGELLWSQAIAYADRPIHLDPARFSQACTPVYAEGVLICPTHLGVLIGVDAVTGMLLWPYYTGDEINARRVGRWATVGRMPHGHAGFANPPVIDGQRIVHLPRYSRHIHCLDLHSGARHWQAARNDAEYIGAVSNGTVVVVGSRYCRGLSLETGEEQWTTRLGLPSGRGLQAGEHYLVPLQNGRVVMLDMPSGREVGHTIAATSGGADASSGSLSDAPAAAGNLVAAEDFIVSVGPRRVSVYPQAASLLGRVKEEIARRKATQDRLLLAAELELTLGQTETARQRLERLLRAEAPLAARARDHMRELLYADLRRPNADVDRILARLDGLSGTPAERGRYLARRAELQLAEADFEGVMQSAREFSQLELAAPLPMEGNPMHLVSGTSWVAAMLGRVYDRMDSEARNDVAARIAAEQQEALALRDTARLRQFLAQYAGWPQAAAVRIELARQARAAGRFQEAELLLLEVRRSGSRTVAQWAAAELADLWIQLGLYHEAAGLLTTLEREAPELPVNENETVRQFVGRLATQPLIGDALRQTRPVPFAVERVQISESRWTETDARIEAAYTGFRRRLRTPDDFTFQLVDKGTSDGDAGNLAIIDSHTGVLTGRIAIPARNTYTSSPLDFHVGHFFPLGSSGELHGVSLLEHSDGKPLWTVSPGNLPRLQEQMRVGPAGPTFCIFQGRQQLIVVDPATGRTLWQRNDLDPDTGLHSDNQAGVFGDSEVIVVFGGDRMSYVVYRTATGEELRRGRLDVHVNQQRRVFGRKLFYLTGTAGGLRMRIWDPLDDRVEFDQPAPPRVVVNESADGELAVLVPPNRFQVIDVATGEVKVDLALGPAEMQNLAAIPHVFSDHERYYVNLQREQLTHTARSDYQYYATDTFLPSQHLQGDVYAVDRETGQLLWKRTIRQRTFVQTPHIDLPFLIAVSRVRDRWNGQRQSMLLEVIDAETGETIGTRENIVPDRLLQLSYSPEESRVTIHGLQTTIKIDFGPEVQRRTVKDRPL